MLAISHTVDMKAKLFRGFADSSRLAILESLRRGACTVSGLVEATGLVQPNVSNHLACLLDCELVVREQQGRYAIYSLADARAESILRLAEELLAEGAAGVASCDRYAGRDSEDEGVGAAGPGFGGN